MFSTAARHRWLLRCAVSIDTSMQGSCGEGAEQQGWGWQQQAVAEPTRATGTWGQAAQGPVLMRASFDSMCQGGSGAIPAPQADIATGQSCQAEDGRAGAPALLVLSHERTSAHWHS